MRIRVSDNVNILFYFPLSVNISLETGSFILQFIPFISYFFFLYKGSFHRFSMFPDFSGFFISSIDEMYIFFFHNIESDGYGIFFGNEPQKLTEIFQIIFLNEINRFFHSC